MSPRVLSLVVVAALTVTQSLAKPSISFAALGAHKDNVISAIGGFKRELFRPLAPLVNAKAQILR